MAEKPLYRLIKALYADDTYFGEGTEIYFDGTPNENMEPLNDAAREKMQDYIKALEDGMKEAGRISRALEDIVFHEFKNRPRDSGVPTGRVELPRYNPETPLAGNMAKPAPAKVEVKALPGGPPKPKPVVIGEAKL